MADVVTRCSRAEFERRLRARPRLSRIDGAYLEIPLEVTNQPGSFTAVRSELVIREDGTVDLEASTEAQVQAALAYYDAPVEAER